MLPLLEYCIGKLSKLNFHPLNTKLERYSVYLELTYYPWCELSVLSKMFVSSMPSKDIKMFFQKAFQGLQLIQMQIQIPQLHLFQQPFHPSVSEGGHTSDWRSILGCTLQSCTQLFLRSVSYDSTNLIFSHVPKRRILLPASQFQRNPESVPSSWGLHRLGARKMFLGNARE